MTRKEPIESTMDLVLSLVLRLGLSAAILVIVIGGVLYFIGNGTLAVDDRVFKGVPSPKDLVSLLASSWKGDGESWIHLGIILLVATPVARVASCAGIFLIEKDYFYVAASLFVLLVLLYSLI
jgi:uncharacterized membrane protein